MVKKKKVEEISFQAQVAFEEGEKGEAAKWSYLESS